MADEARGRVPILAGAAEPNIDMVVQACKRYADLGCRAVSVTGPYYFKVSQHSIEPTPFFPACGPVTGSFNGLHRESNFLAILATFLKMAILTNVMSTCVVIPIYDGPASDRT